MRHVLRLHLLLVLVMVYPGPRILAQEVAREAIPSWPAPPSWSPGQSDSGGSGMTDLSSPLPFIAITPCRIADTRGNGFTGQAGPPTLVANNTARNFQIDGTVPGVTTQCGIPMFAAAVSFNFAIVNPSANGNLVVYPKGAPAPTVSSLNWQVGFAALSNAAVIPLSGSPGPGGISVIVNSPFGSTVDLVIDVNGYYRWSRDSAPLGGNTFLGLGAGNSFMTGANNSGFGAGTLPSNTTGESNTAIGAIALLDNTSGTGNTAIGYGTLVNNTVGNGNVAVGDNSTISWGDKL